MPTKQQLEAIIALDNHKDLCREENDKRYAKKIVERIVYSMISIILTGVILKLVQLAFTNK